MQPVTLLILGVYESNTELKHKKLNHVTDGEQPAGVPFNLQCCRCGIRTKYTAYRRLSAIRPKFLRKVKSTT